MNKGELIVEMASKSGLSEKNAKKALDAFIKIVTDELASGEKVQIVGFGTFETGVRSAREGRNPVTGEKINIPEKRVPKFKAGKNFKDSIC